MSNLGGYQTLTTMAKKVGGPRNLVLVFLASGAVLGKISEIIIEQGIKGFRGKIHKEDYLDDMKIYEVEIYGISNEGLEFSVGDKFKVLEVEKDAVLIDKIREKNNPYFVSSQFLQRISDYKE